MPLSAATRTGLRVAQTGLWADHGCGLWVFRLKGPDSLRSHCTEMPGPAVGRAEAVEGEEAELGGGVERRKWRGQGGEEEGQVRLQGLTLDLPQALWSCWWCRAVSNPLGPGRRGW